ncbi:MAG: tetratricopeptide repeat protein [Bacteroidetes bacterium SW_11_45_7]|nr:MAG: tetratricopeptide repeat protein [Bacteroidetes bacterium SW_11_45_7]
MQKTNNRLEQLFQYLETNPNDSFARFCIAQEYVKEGKIDKAKGYFRVLKQHDPAYIGTYYHLGKLFEEEGDDDQAAQVYQEGITMANKNGDQHALNELKQAMELLTGGDDEFEEEV